MKIKSAFCSFVLIISIIASMLTAVAAETDWKGLVIYAADSVVVSQLEPGKKWQPGEELSVDVNHKDVALIKFKLPSELESDVKIVVRLYSTVSYHSEWKLYGMKNISWDSTSFTYNKANGQLSKNDYSIFGGDSKYIATFPLLGDNQICGEIDVTDYIISNNIKGNVTFGINALTSKSRIASHLYSEEACRPSIIISKKESLEYTENIDENIFADAIKFSDVLGYLPSDGGFYYPDREVSADEVNYAFGLMNHNTGEVFKRNTDVTAEKIIKELVTVSGYDVLVKVSDRYTYLTAASYADILDQVQIDDYKKNITRAVFAQLLYNTLNINVLEHTSLGTLDSYGEKIGETVLSRTRNIYRADGIVDGNEYTYLTNKAVTSKGMVSIDGKLYYNGDTDATDMLGYRVIAWYYDSLDAGSDELAYLAQDMHSEDILDIRYDEIIDYTSFQYQYDKDDSGRISRAKLDKGFDVIFNGVCKSDFELSDIKPAYGMVRLINNDSDSTFDVVKVHSYENYVVTLADDSKYEIVDYYNPKRHQIIDESSDQTLITDISGLKIEFDDIRQWNVVSVAKSSDGKTVKAIVNTETVSGKVMQLMDDEVMVDNVLYDIAPSFLPYSKNVLILGDNVTLLIDALGNIAGCRLGTASELRYGYLIDAKLTNGMDKALQCKIFTDNGSIVYLNAGDKITIDGERYTDGNTQLNNLNGTEQLIMYRTDAEGYIAEIDTKHPGAKEGVKQLTEIMPLTSGLIYRSRAKSLSSKLVMSNDTIIFAIPDNPKNADEDDFEIKRIGNYFNDQTLNSVCGYTAGGDSLMASAITVNNAPVNGYEYMMLIDTVSVVLDADGEKACKLTGIINGAMDAVIISGDFCNQAQGFEQGDFIRFSKNGYGKVIKLQHVYDISSNNPFLLEQPTSVRADYRVSYQRIHNRKGNVIQTTMDFSGADPISPEVYDASLFPIYVYDKYVNSKRVYLGGVSMLTDYSNMLDVDQKIIVCTNYGDPMAIIVYR